VAAIANDGTTLFVADFAKSTTAISIKLNNEHEISTLRLNTTSADLSEMTDKQYSAHN
jgi:hypothetical protein